jgi:hypothetical protein
VPTPADFGLPYEDLVLTTPDNVTLRSYLLVQRRDLGDVARSTGLDTSSFVSDSEVFSRYSVNPGTLKTDADGILVCGHTTHGDDVPREWWKLWAPGTPREDLLRKDAL